MKIKIIFLSAFLVIGFQSCILEDFETIPVNIPVSIPIDIEADLLPVMEFSIEFCLDSNEVYMDYKGKTRRLTLVESAFRFSEVSPQNMSGDLRFVLRKNDQNGDVLIDQTIADFIPSQHTGLNRPRIVPVLLGDEAFSGEHLCFYSFISLNNITPAGTEKVLKGYVDLLFKAEVEF